MTKASLFIFNKNYTVANTAECLVKTTRYPNQETIPLNSSLRVKFFNESPNPQLRQALLFPKQLINGYLRFYKTTGDTCDILFTNAYLSEFNIYCQPENTDTAIIELVIEPKMQQFIDLIFDKDNSPFGINSEEEKNKHHNHWFLFGKN